MTSCGSEDTDTAPASPSATAAETETSPSHNANDNRQDSDTLAPSKTAEPETASGVPSDSQTAHVYADSLESMAEEDALLYTGNGSGPLAGTRFQTADGSVHCQIVTKAVACTVPDAAEAWPEDERADEANDGSSESVDTLGWSEMVGAPLSQEPMNWQQQDNFPYVDTGVELPDQRKLDVTTDLEDPNLDAVCGVDDDTVICTIGKHGFAVSQSVYETW